MGAAENDGETAMNGYTLYRFDDFALDPAKRMLWRDGERVAIQPKVFDCLAYLIENRERTVGHDELIAAVWGRVDLSDHVVVNTIGRARQAVGDTGDKQRVIRTLARVGYSWVLSVDETQIEPPGSNNSHFNEHANGDGSFGAILSAANGTQGQVAIAAAQVANGGAHKADNQPSQLEHADTRLRDAGAPASSTASSRLYQRSAVLVALALTFVLAVAWIIAVRIAEPPTPIDGETAVVLPVTVVSDEQDSWIRLGVMDLIADRLRAAGQAVVPSENTVALARGIDSEKPITPAQLEAIALATTAELILSAEAERVRDRWQVTLRTMRGRDRILVAPGDGEDVLTAARSAADRMAYMLGYVQPPLDPVDADQALDQLIRRMRAAGLAADYDEVRAFYASAAPEHQAHPRVRFHVAGTDWRTGRFAEARAGFLELLMEVSAGNDVVLTAKMHYGVAVAHFIGGDTDAVTAERHLTEAIRLTESREGYEARNLLGNALSLRGGVYGMRQQHAAALSDFSRARFALQSTANQVGLGILDNNLALVHGIAGRFEEAITHAKRSAESASRFNNPRGELTARDTLANARLAILDPKAAIEDEGKLRELLKQVADPSLNVLVKLTIARILIGTGRWQDARALLIELLDRQDADQVPEREPRTRALLAQLDLQASRPDQAARQAAQAREHSWWQGAGGLDAIRPTHARLFLTQMRAQLAQDDVQGATTTLTDALSWAKDVDDSVVEIYGNLLQAEHAAAIGENDSAASAFAAADAGAEALRVPYLLLEVAQSYTRWLLDEGEAADAAIAAGRVAIWADKHYDAALLQLRVHHALGDTTPWRSSLTTVRSLAGEREVPVALLEPPSRANLVAETATVDDPY